MSDYSLIVRGGLVVDGTGLPRRRVDVGVRDGPVAAIARLDRDATVRKIVRDNARTLLALEE